MVFQKGEIMKKTVKKAAVKKKPVEKKEKKVTELMELQNIVVRMHKKIDDIESKVKRISDRMGL